MNHANPIIFLEHNVEHINVEHLIFCCVLPFTLTSI